MNELVKIFSWNIRSILKNMIFDFTLLQEIRMRVQAPLCIRYNNEDFYISKLGQFMKSQEEAYIVTQMDLRETLELASNHSLYAYEDEIRQGFLTIQGGHRIGIAGKTIMENGTIRTMKYISFLNIRIAHEVKGCADFLMPYIVMGNEEVMQSLIISPPRCGKTTILRDIIRQLSNEYQLNVGVVDERSEIGACYMGIPQNDIGMRTDLLDCCPKVEGMMMLIRTMSPQVVAVDEIGSVKDLEAIEYVVNSGAKLIATVHGSSMEDMKNKPVLKQMIEQKIFQRYIVLEANQVGKIKNIFDENGGMVV